jgi:hypothetical protein
MTDPNRVEPEPSTTDTPPATTKKTDVLPLREACFLIFRRGWSVLRTLGACAIVGVVVSMLKAQVS